MRRVPWILLALLLCGAKELRAGDGALGRGPDFGVEEPKAFVQRGRRLALCIGINGYRGERYRALNYATTDARALATTLENLGYAVTLMVDDEQDLAPDLVPTYRNLDDHLFRFCQRSRSPADTLIVAFAGHGDVVGGQSVLIPADFHEAGRPVTLGAVFDAIQTARAAKKLLIVDACRSAAPDGERRLATGFLETLAGAQTFMALSGCGADQSSYEDPDLGHGRLTWALLRGLRGDAYASGSEFLFGTDLWSFVERTFHDRAWVSMQSPRLFGSWDARVRFDLARRELPPPLAAPPSDPATAARTLERAWQRYVDRDVAACVDLCQAALVLSPHAPSVLALRGLAYVTLGYPEKAKADRDACLAGRPDDLWGRLAVAVDAADRGDGNVARANLDVALRVIRGVEASDDSGPTALATAWQTIGFLHQTLGDPPEAVLESWEASLAVSDAPETLHAQTLVDRALLLLRLRQEGRAAEDCVRVLGLERAHGAQRAMAAYVLGLLNARDGRFQDAGALFSRALNTPGILPEMACRAFTRLGQVDESLGNADRALLRYAAALEVVGAPAYALGQALLARGRVQASAGRYEEALADFQRAERLPGAPAPDVVDAQLYRAEVLRVAGRWAEARIAYGQVIENVAATPVQRAGALAARAEVARADGLSDPTPDLRRALALLDAAPAGGDDVEHAEARLKLLFGLGRTQEAMRELDGLLARRDEDPDRLARWALREGRALREAGRVREAAETLRSVGDIPDVPGPVLSRALVELADLCYEANDHPSASVLATRVIEGEHVAEDARARACLIRGVIHQARGQVEEALGDYHGALTLAHASPDDAARAGLRAGLLLAANGRREDAIRCQGLVLEIERAAADLRFSALRERALLLRQEGRSVEALADFERASQLPGVAPQERLLAGVVRAVHLGLMGRYEAAIDVLDGLLREAGEQDVGLPMLLLVRAYVRSSDPDAREAATADVGRAAAREHLGAEETVLLAVVRARLLRLGGDLDGAEAALASVESREEPSPQVRGMGQLEVAWILYGRGELEGARRLAERAAASAPELAEAHRLQALVHLGQGEWTSASRALERALVLGPVRAAWIEDLDALRRRPDASPDLDVVLAWLHAKHGDAEEAARLARTYLEAHPDGDFAGLARQILGAPSDG